MKSEDREILERIIEKEKRTTEFLCHFLVWLVYSWPVWILILLCLSEGVFGPEVGFGATLILMWNWGTVGYVTKAIMRCE